MILPVYRIASRKFSKGFTLSPVTSIRYHACALSHFLVVPTKMALHIVAIYVFVNMVAMDHRQVFRLAAHCNNMQARVSFAMCLRIEFPINFKNCM